MKRNITLSADERMIELARQKALREHKSLNIAFREWLALYVGNTSTAQNYRRLMKGMSEIKSNKKFTRDELNER